MTLAHRELVIYTRILESTPTEGEGKEEQDKAEEELCWDRFLELTQIGRGAEPAQPQSDQALDTGCPGKGWAFGQGGFL